MYFEQFYLTCLAHASYLIGSEGEAAVVDPQRDVDIYLKAADEQNLKIRHIFETHLHADFVSGHKELAARTGAKIYIGAQAHAEFQHVPLTDGLGVKMGAVRLRALETPGHTPESICLVITDEKESSSGQPCAVLTGDTLFIGDVGPSRPFAHSHAAGTGGIALRQSAPKAAGVAGCGDGVSRARRRFAVWTRHAGRALVHDRDRAAYQLRVADREPGRVHRAVDRKPPGSSRLFS
ncbi:MAG: MBL fold metallo-hydrolase [Candidatus Sulfotelmatobacter sp.]